MTMPTLLTRDQNREADPLLARCDSPAAALAALDRRFHGDIARWLAWLRWLDEDVYRAD